MRAWGNATPWPRPVEPISSLLASLSPTTAWGSPCLRAKSRPTSSSSRLLLGASRSRQMSAGESNWAMTLNDGSLNSGKGPGSTCPNQRGEMDPWQPRLCHGRIGAAQILAHDSTDVAPAGEPYCFDVAKPPGGIEVQEVSGALRRFKGHAAIVASRGPGPGQVEQCRTQRSEERRVRKESQS